MGPRRFRTRLDYNDPVIPFHGSHHHGMQCFAFVDFFRQAQFHVLFILLLICILFCLDNVGACSNPYSDDYHVPNVSSQF